MRLISLFFFFSCSFLLHHAKTKNAPQTTANPKFKERNKIRTSGGRGLAFVQAKRFSKPFNVYGNSEEDLDQDPLSSKASSASALESANYLTSSSRKQRSDEYDEEQMDETVFEQEQLEDEDALEDLDEDERIIEDEELEEQFEQDLEFDDEKLLSEDEPSRDKSKSSDREDRPRSRDRLYSDDFEFECDLTDSERNLMKQKMNEKYQPAQHATKKTKVPVKTKKRRTSQSSDENLLSPYRRQSVGHSPTNRTSMRPQLINTKRQKKFKSRLHVDAHRRRYSDVFFANTPILQPTSQPSSRLSNISDQAVSGTLSACSTRPSSASKLDSRPQSALDSLLNVVQQQQQQQQQQIVGEQRQKEEYKVAPVQLLNNALKEPSSITPTLYVRNRSPSCAVVPSHYLKQNQSQQRAAEAKQAKRRGMSLSFTPSGARHLTNQVTRKLSKQLSKFNQGTKNLLGKSSASKQASPRSKEHSISMESSKDVVREISQLYSSVETPPSSIIIGANVLIYPMVNTLSSPVQATLNQASLAAVAGAKLDSQFGFDGAKTKERDAAIGKDGHTFMSQMKKAKNVFRSFIPLQLNADNFTSSLFDLKECLPGHYYSAKGIDKSIKVSLPLLKRRDDRRFGWVILTLHGCKAFQVETVSVPLWAICNTF